MSGAGRNLDATRLWSLLLPLFLLEDKQLHYKPSHSSHRIHVALTLDCPAVACLFCTIVGLTPGAVEEALNTIVAISSSDQVTVPRPT